MSTGANTKHLDSLVWNTSNKVEIMIDCDLEQIEARRGLNKVKCRLGMVDEGVRAVL